MRDLQRPMPPAYLPQATPAEIAALDAWVASGLLAGNCGSTTSTDAGPPTPPAPAPTVCTSGDSWDRGDDGSPLMHPGRACITCHRTESEAPRLTIAGTVYPSLHERNDCYGDRDVTIVITDAAGQVVRLLSNDYGNFLSRAPLTLPIRARLESNGRVREMLTPQMSGDCNSCHSEQGANGAPGRILRP